MIHGVLLIALFACASFYIGEARFLKELSISPMIIGIILGMIYANSLRNHLPDTWVPGIQFCSKRLLRLGIIFYGFRLTLQDIAVVGVPGVIVDAIVVTVTILGGVLIGRMMKMDRDTALLTSVGSGICGAAAVLGAEATIRSPARRLLGKYNLCTVQRLAALGTALQPERAADFAALSELAEQLDADGVCCRVSQLAVNGRDLMAAGVPAGPGIRKVLEALLDGVIREEYPNERQALLAAVQQLAAS